MQRPRVASQPSEKPDATLLPVALAPGSQVLDLGCGRALTSIFVAREFGLQVTAADLWIAAEDNQARIDAAGLSAAVVAVRAEAHSLPFEREAFDAIVSFDAYHYFGTDVCR